MGDIKSLVRVANGTINVASGASVGQSISIAEPNQRFSRFVLMFNNGTTSAISSIALNTSATSVGSLSNKSVQISSKQPINGGSGADGSVLYNIVNDIYPFVGGSISFEANLSAATTAAGTIDWSLFAY